MGVEAGQVAEVVELRGVPAAEAALAAEVEVVVRGAVVLRTVATRNQVGVKLFLQSFWQGPATIRRALSNYNSKILALSCSATPSPLLGYIA
jgi:hypothetical protein